MNRLSCAMGILGGAVLSTACGVILDVGDNEQKSAIDDEGDVDVDEVEPDRDLPLCPDADTFEPVDPGASLENWTAQGGAVVDNDGVTAAVFLSGAVEEGRARLFTDVEMPSCFVPMALQLDTSIGGRDYAYNTSVALLGGVPFDLGYLGQDGTTGCVGARAFGGTRRLDVRVRGGSGFDEEMGEVESVHLVAEPACPPPGDVVPFDQWTLSASYADFGASIALVDGQLDMRTGGACDDVRAQGPEPAAIAFPDAAGVGLRVFVEAEGDFGQGDDWNTDGLTLAVGPVVQRLHDGENLLCLPRAMRGTSNRMALGLWANGGSCGDPTVMHARVHPPEIVEGACDDANVPGGDMDGSGGSVSSSLTAVPIAAFGDGVFSVDVSTQCATGRLTIPGSIPEATAGAGPALVTTHTLTGELGAWWSLSDLSPTRGTFAVSEVPLTTTTCLPRSRGGELVTFDVTVGGSAGSCGQPALPGRFELDDLDVVLDPACAP